MCKIYKQSIRYWYIQKIKLAILINKNELKKSLKYLHQRGRFNKRHSRLLSCGRSLLKFGNRKLSRVFQLPSKIFTISFENTLLVFKKHLFLRSFHEVRSRVSEFQRISALRENLSCAFQMCPIDPRAVRFLHFWRRNFLQISLKILLHLKRTGVIVPALEIMKIFRKRSSRVALELCANCIGIFFESRAFVILKKEV